jgi:hypothetical protein
MVAMERARFQLSVSSMLGLVACVAVNIGLFRFGALWGIVGLNITKHVFIAYLCRTTGVDRTRSPSRARVPAAPVPPVTVS